MGLYDQLEDMDGILDDFVIESGELIEDLNTDLLSLEGNELDLDRVNHVFRAFHTIKGTAGFLNFTDCGVVAHAAENILNKFRSGDLEPTPFIIDVLLDAVDWIKAFLSDVENRIETSYDITALVTKINKIFEAEYKIEQAKTEEPASPEEFIEENNEDPDPESSAVTEITIPKELVDEFISEVTELIELLDNDLLTLEIEVDNEEFVNSIFRAFHTLKGNSGLIGLEDMSVIAHKSEDLLSMIRSKKIVPSSETVDVLLSAVDFMREVLDEVTENKIVKHDISSIKENLNLALGIRGSQPATKQQPQPQSKPKTKSEPLPQTKPQSPKKASTPVLKKISQSKIDQTIRVDVERLNKLLNLVGELVLEKNRLGQVSKELLKKYPGTSEVDDLDSLNNSLGMVTTEIQESVMQTRMLPISYVFKRFPRLIRDLARNKEKIVELVLSGESTELDRSVIEAIGDPLVHLLRNAVDHGIETPQTRKNIGKPIQGTIRLSAYQEGNHIVINIEDDGSGIDTDVILQKAIEKDVITEQEGNSLSKKDIVNLIFKAGFSTAKVVTDVSGRGVGLDVVHSNISKLNGTVEINTEKGEGSTFKIKLPLTLTIQTGMVVEVINELYIIPLTSIIETIRLDEEILNTIKGQEMIKLRDSVLPIVRLDNWLNVPQKVDQQKDEYVVIVAVAERRLGIVVSRLVNQEETVVKPLGETMGKVPYIAGATIRGDGNISLILDIPEMLEILSSSEN